MEQEQLTALIEKSKAGDRQAQEKLVREAQTRVYYHCKKMLKNEDDALDATQDVLIAMLTGLDKLRQPAAFWGWVNGITANRCKHLLTQGTKEWQIPEDEEGNSLLDSMETLDDQVVPDKAVDNAETQRLMMELIDNLPPEQKMSVLFFYYDEMSVKEIAAAMGVSEGTVKSRLNYARKSIKEGVDSLAKKGTKLYGISPLPFLAYFLRQYMAAEGALSPAAASALTQGVLASAGTGAAAAGTAAGAASSAGTAAAGTATAAETAAASSVGTMAAGAAGTAAKGLIGSKLALGLVGLAVAGTVAGGAVLSTRQAPPEPTHSSSIAAVMEEIAPTPEPTPEPTPLPEAFVSACTDKVLDLLLTSVPEEDPQTAATWSEELQQAVEKRRKALELAQEGKRYGEYLFDLAYIDEDSIPELVAVFNGSSMSIYTYADGKIYPVKEDWAGSRLGFPSYYPGQNVICESYSSMAADHMSTGTNCYRINESHQLETFFQRRGEQWGDGREVPETVQGEEPDLEGLESIQLGASLSASELLELLGEPPELQPVPASETPSASGDFVIENDVLVKYNGPGGDVVIPDGVTAIGNEAFRDCAGLTGVTIPDSVTTIGDKAFFWCCNLTSLNIPDSVTAIGTEAFFQCSGLTSITIPDSITEIGNGVFASCTGLTSITIPDSVTKIGVGTFSYCTGLTGVTILNRAVAFGKHEAFKGCDSLVIYAPAGSTAEAHAAQYNISFEAT